MKSTATWHDALLFAAVCAGTGYCFAPLAELSVAAGIAWKGAGVSLLALWCMTQARGADGWLLAAVMAFGALGDVLLEARGLTAGATAFAAGHLVAMALYLRNWRAAIRLPERLGAALLVPLAVFVALISSPPDQWPGIAVYAFLVAAMTASAWTSRFPQNRTGIGAMMFLLSDLLIFLQLGPLAGSVIPGLLIWPFYFAGQLLIALGVTQTLRGDRQQIAVK